jgi:hypothetical protein
LHRGDALSVCQVHRKPAGGNQYATHRGDHSIGLSSGAVRAQFRHFGTGREVMLWRSQGRDHINDWILASECRAHRRRADGPYLGRRRHWVANPTWRGGWGLYPLGISSGGHQRCRVLGVHKPNRSRRELNRVVSITNSLTRPLLTASRTTSVFVGSCAIAMTPARSKRTARSAQP